MPLTLKELQHILKDEKGTARRRERPRIDLSFLPERPLPATLFRSPISPPLSRLVHVKSLPVSIREKYATGSDVVEIPRSVLDPERPEPTNTTRAVNQVNARMAPPKRKNTHPLGPGALNVLRQTVRQSYLEGSLLTGAKDGITWEIAYGEPDPKPQQLVDQRSEQEQAEDVTPTASIAPKWKMQEILDDDSLFGSDSSDEESETEEPQVEESPQPESVQVKPTVPDDTDGDVDEDIDVLLQAFSPAGSSHAVGTALDPSNPLALAQLRAQDMKNDKRKHWASTNLLPIRDFRTWVPSPALEFPFALDDFQQQAIVRLERSESVFVAAHTSAGKTVGTCVADVVAGEYPLINTWIVAEYAIALAKQRSTRCIYTSPIKALSNQKFRDFSKKFGAENVGLVTGDMQVNSDDATCIIMTTEILRSMLYRGADLIRDIEFVVFDEVHYVNDTERGVVWEEVIILLPSYANMIFLSATTPNTLEFSDWIGRTKRKPVYVVKTDYRPVPLSHHLWAGLKLHKVMEGASGFLESGYRDAATSLLPKSARDASKKKEVKPKHVNGSKQLLWQQPGTRNNWMSLVRFLDRELLTPTVVFSFSKKKCEEIAGYLQSLDLNTSKERSAVQGFCLQTVARLSSSDVKLPQVRLVCEMVQRGIGVHHGGLLPILKEMVEILFSRNLIKVLFATETFAMGVNMPTRSVVFGSIRKHDGTQFRNLEPGEMIQMSGRAGRRGLDEVGTVIICCFGEEPPPQQLLRQMLMGTSTRLRSQFRLTYNMILNLLRVEEMSVESMIKKSYSEFTTQRALYAKEYPQLLVRGMKTLDKLESQQRDRAGGPIDISEYFSASLELARSTGSVLDYLLATDERSFEVVLGIGRVILVASARHHLLVRSPALVLQATPNPSGASSVRCLALCSESFTVSEGSKVVADVPASVGEYLCRHGRYFSIIDVPFANILAVSGTKEKIDVSMLLKADVISSGTTSLVGFGRPLVTREIEDPFAGMMSRNERKHVSNGKTPSSASVLETIAASLLTAERCELKGSLDLFDLGRVVTRGDQVFAVRQACDRIVALIAQVRASPSHKYPNVEKYYVEFERIASLRERVDNLRHLLSNEALQLFPDFQQRKAVLRRLGCIDSKDSVMMKGRVACEVNTCDEIVAAELVLEGILNDLEPAEIAAVLSSLVFQEKVSTNALDSEVPPRLMNASEKIENIALKLGAIQKELGLYVDPQEYAESTLNFGLLHAVYEWAMGIPFQNICELTDVQEGSIVRCITRLDELCREVRNCARVVGNPTLYRKLEAARTAIKRDIVFAASLYVS